jgi:hypothetical protein
MSSFAESQDDFPEILLGFRNKRRIPPPKTLMELLDGKLSPLH